MGQAGGEERRRSQGAVPVSEYRLHDEHLEVVGGAPAYALHSNGEVGGRELIVPDANLRTNKFCLGMRKAAQRDGIRGNGEGREVFLSQRNELLMIDSAGSN